MMQAVIWPGAIQFGARRFLHPVRGDARNFHAWKYRFWLVPRLGRSEEDELAFTQRLLEADRRNFSAWHYRSVLLPRVHAARGHRTLEELLADNSPVPPAVVAHDQAAEQPGIEESRASVAACRPIPLYELQAELDFLHEVLATTLVYVSFAGCLCVLRSVEDSNADTCCRRAARLWFSSSLPTVVHECLGA
jgi:Protein prenyltransferase alpha subunit repeat